METRTNIVLDDELIDKAMSKAGVTTKKAAVEVALRDYVREPDWKGLLELEGSGSLADDYDPEALFSSEHEVREPAPSYRPSARKTAKTATTRSAKSTSRRK